MKARTWSDGAAFCVTALLGSLLYWRFVQRAAFQPLLALGPEQQTATEARLIWATVCAETLLLVLPGLLISLVLRAAQKRRAALGVFVLWSSFVVTIETLDLRTNAAFGRHLCEIVRFAGYRMRRK